MRVRILLPLLQEVQKLRDAFGLFCYSLIVLYSKTKFGEMKQKAGLDFVKTVYRQIM
jgi:hypothetical protein